MLIRRGFCLIVFACVATFVRCELFTSMAHLQTALHAEKDISQAIKDYIQEEEDRLTRLKSIADDFEHHSLSVLESKKNYLANPVNAYLYVKRFTIDWDSVIAPLLKGDTENEVHQKIEELKRYLPNYEDLNGAVAALLRLQDTYKLNTDDLARGMVGGLESNTMSAHDCFEIGRYAYQQKDFFHCSKWMNEALEKELDERNKTVLRSAVLDYLAYSNLMQGNIRQALTLTDELLSIVPLHTRAQNNRSYYKKMLEDKEKSESKRGDDGSDDLVEKKEQQQDGPPGDSYRKSHEFKTYESLCRGEQTHNYRYKHLLRCRYKTNGHPLLLLLPAKEEDVYLNPWIVIYRDIVTDYEIETIKRIATPKLDRATVHNARTGKLETATYRVSKSAWLREGDDAVIRNVNNRIQAVTGLDMKTAEDLQVANYGLGGHYEPHFDFARKEETNAFKSLGTGNRIATWLTYMTDVDAGGATVFPYIGVKLFPQKGVAAFWYNLYKNGEGIYNTRHAACPVLVGEKWVSNKWIHERGQEFRRRCGLHADE